MKARHRSTTGFDFKTPKDKENPLYQQEYLDIPESNIKVIIPHITFTNTNQIGTKNDSTQPTKIKALTLKIKHLSFSKSIIIRQLMIRKKNETRRRWRITHIHAIQR